LDLELEFYVYGRHRGHDSTAIFNLGTPGIDQQGDNRPIGRILLRPVLLVLSLLDRSISGNPPMEGLIDGLF
jgi:hypothetical protein